MKHISLLLTTLCLTFSCATPITKQKHKLIQQKTYEMEHSPEIGKTFAGQTLFLGGFSGLNFLYKTEDGSLYFQSVTDRGPVALINKSDRPFLLPDFTPRMVVLKVNPIQNKLEIAAEIKLKQADGKLLTGLPNNREPENPTDVFGMYYSIDQNGLYIKGLSSDGDGGWWIADEYGPSLVHFNQEAQMTKRLIPDVELPRFYKNVSLNRGFEGVAKTKTKLFGFLQTVHPIDKDSEKKFARIAEVDLETFKTTAEYLYPFEANSQNVSDAFALNEKTFLVLEQNGKAGAESKKYLFKIILGESDQFVAKNLVLDLNNTTFENVDRIAGVTLIDSNKIGIIYNNQYEVQGAIDSKSGKVNLENKKNKLVVLEFEKSLL